MTEAEETARQRGREQGAIESQLAQHAEHLERINGSTERTSQNLQRLDLAMQHMIDAFAAAADTVVATAKALEEAEQARRIKSEQVWSPVQKAIAVLMMLFAGMTVYAIFFYGRK